MSLERTRKAVSHQLTAMGLEQFEIGVYHPQRGMIIRRRQVDEVLNDLGWLRYMNAIGNHIYVRPAQSRGVILLDDLNRGAFNRLSKDGFAPAVVVQTSPGNFQCWLRLIANRQNRWIDTSWVTSVCRRLAKVYDADPGSADWRHFGRLAGFTNRKPRHQRHGLFPFVLLEEAWGSVAAKGRPYLQEAKQEAMEGRQSHRRQSRRQSRLPEWDAAADYDRRLNRLLAANRRQPWCSNPDWSRVDFMIARDMLGCSMGQAEVLACIRYGSPELYRRKGRNVEAYLNRTIWKAMQALPFSHPPRMKS